MHEKVMKRAERRRRTAAIHARRRKRLDVTIGPAGWYPGLAETPHPCSRQCCGNPRHHFNGPTVQERRLPKCLTFLEF